MTLDADGLEMAGNEALCQYCRQPITFLVDQIGGWWTHPFEADDDGYQGYHQRCEDGQEYAEPRAEETSR